MTAEAPVTTATAVDVAKYRLGHRPWSSDLVLTLARVRLGASERTLDPWSLAFWHATKASRLVLRLGTIPRVLRSSVKTAVGLWSSLDVTCFGVADCVGSVDW